MGDDPEEPLQDEQWPPPFAEVPVPFAQPTPDKMVIIGHIVAAVPTALVVAEWCVPLQFDNRGDLVGPTWLLGDGGELGFLLLVVSFSAGLVLTLTNNYKQRVIPGLEGGWAMLVSLFAFFLWLFRTF